MCRNWRRWSPLSGYGQGWNLSDYGAHKLVWHTGGWPGQVSRLTLVPAEAWRDQRPAPNSACISQRGDLSRAGHDAGPQRQRLAEGVRGLYAKSQADADTRGSMAAMLRRTATPLLLANYAGTYRDPWYGDVLIRQREGLEARVQQGPRTAGDEHWAA